MPWRWLLLTLAAALAAPSAAASDLPTLTCLEALGTVFRATLSDGSVKQGRDLVGMVLVFSKGGAPVRVRIAAIDSDPSDTTGTVSTTFVSPTPTSRSATRRPTDSAPAFRSPGTPPLTTASSWGTPEISS